MDSECIKILDLLRLNKIQEAISVIDTQQQELYNLAMRVVSEQYELAMNVVDMQQRELYNLAMLLYAAVQHDPVSLKTLGLTADSLALKGYDVCNELAMAAASIAAGNGNANAQAFIGHQYSQGEYGDDGLDSVNSLIWYTIAAEQGHAEAQFVVGQSHHYGVGVAVDYEEAAKWYTRAITQGNSDAKRHYGILNNDIALGIPEKGVKITNPFWDFI